MGLLLFSFLYILIFLFKSILTCVFAIHTIFKTIPASHLFFRCMYQAFSVTFRFVDQGSLLFYYLFLGFSVRIVSPLWGSLKDKNVLSLMMTFAPMMDCGCYCCACFFQAFTNNRFLLDVNSWQTRILKGSLGIGIR